MEKYQICEHTLDFPCIGKRKGLNCYGILATTRDPSSSSNEIDIEVDQLLEYLRASYAVDASQRFHYEFQASSNIGNETGSIKFAKTPISDSPEKNSLEFKLLCDIEKVGDCKMKISPQNLNAYTILQNSIVETGKWVD